MGEWAPVKQHGVSAAAFVDTHDTTLRDSFVQRSYINLPTRLSSNSCKIKQLRNLVLGSSRDEFVKLIPQSLTENVAVRLVQGGLKEGL